MTIEPKKKRISFLETNNWEYLNFINIQHDDIQRVPLFSNVTFENVYFKLHIQYVGLSCTMIIMFRNPVQFFNRQLFPNYDGAFEWKYVKKSENVEFLFQTKTPEIYFFSWCTNRNTIWTLKFLFTHKLKKKQETKTHSLMAPIALNLKIMVV